MFHLYICSASRYNNYCLFYATTHLFVLHSQSTVDGCLQGKTHGVYQLARQAQGGLYYLRENLLHYTSAHDTPFFSPPPLVIDNPLLCASLSHLALWGEKLWKMYQSVYKFVFRAMPHMKILTRKIQYSN